MTEDADRKEAGAAAPVNEATAFAPLTRTRRVAAGTKAWVTVRNINAADAMARYVMAWGAGLILLLKEIYLSDESVVRQVKRGKSKERSMCGDMSNARISL